MISFTDVELKNLHNQSMFNRKKILPTGQACACFCCEERFDSSAIKEWTDRQRTALCPNCGIDSVLAETSEIKLTHELITAMNFRWFGSLNEKEFDFIPIK
jgi:hypothetical protein